MKRLTRIILPLLLAAQLPSHSLEAGYAKGDIAANFTIANRLQGGNLSLYAYAGHVVLLDFFAYWCGPCQSSSPDLEKNVAQYYAQQGGNANGVPVTVIAVNIESGNEAATNQFIQNAGLTLVANDYQRLAWSSFGMGYIPHFAIINGVANSPSHRQWEILHTNYGYSGSAFYRGIIDSVQPPPSLWRDATPGSDGWLSLGWFGWFRDSGGNWVFHTEHGWFNASGASTASLWLYDPGLGCWWWTSDTAYPYLYKTGSNAGWYWYQRGGNPQARWFYRISTGQWVKMP